MKIKLISWKFSAEI